MTKRVSIKLNVANALQWLGTLYRNPADAIKEHISNAIDEFQKAKAAGFAPDICNITFTIEKTRVIIEYPFGMDKREFEAVIQRVADSAKKTLDIKQIGQLGIGIFSYQQIGKKCTFFSKKDIGTETIQVTLSEGMDEAESDTAKRRDALEQPGIKIVISELKFDPTKPRGPLAPEKLCKIFSEKFDGYLKKGWLRINIVSGRNTYPVEPLRFALPRVAKGLDNLHLPNTPSKRVGLDLYFDQSGKGTVAIRHMGVVVVDDLKHLSASEAYGLEDSVYAQGYVKGFIDADFIQPLPARTGFQVDKDWISLLDLLDKQCPQIQAEVEELKQEEKEKSLTEIQRRAIELAREILDLDDFKDLELLGGLTRIRQQPEGKPDVPKEPAGKRTGERSKEPGERREPSGPRINYEEIPFEDGSSHHSRFIGGIVQANTINSDYLQEMMGTEETKLAYATLIIGKETIAYNDKTKAVDDYLEKLLGFYFKLKTRLPSKGSIPGKKGAGRSRKLI